MTNTILQRATAIVAKVAAAHVTDLATLQDRGAGEGATDDAVAAALPHFPTEGYEDGFCITDLKAVGAAFREKKRGKLTASRISWELRIEAMAKIVCFAATRHSTSDEARATLRELATGLAESGLLGTTVTRMELSVKTGSPFFHGKRKGKDAWLAEHEGALVFARMVNEYEDEPRQKVIVLAAGSTFVVPADATETTRETVSIPDDRAFIDETFRELDARGPVPYAPTAAAVVMAEVPITAAEAVLLLAGLPQWGEYRSDFLGKELRTALDLKQSDAAKAKDKLNELPDGQRFALLAGAANVPTAKGLWAAPEDPESSARALANAAKVVLGKTVAVREELVAAMEKEISLELPVRKALALALTAGDDDNPLLTPRRPPPKWFQLGDGGEHFSAESVSKSRHFSGVSAGLAGMAFRDLPGSRRPRRGGLGPGTEVAEPHQAPCRRSAAFGRPLRTFYSAASTLPAPRRRTRLAQYGGPRAGVRFGTSVGSPMPRRYRATLVGSVTSASSFILPLQHGQVKTSNPKVRLRSSAHGR
ncbi:MAG: hypothetical protein IPK71_36320 [Myxococcales bacterium]|nr:hypothetical protein [Myxococcales bacterium]